MRNIIVSMDVFAALWAARLLGEDSENAVLERLLGLPRGPTLPVFVLGRPGPANGAARHSDSQGGIYNRMFDVRFPPGFEIFRTYKGKSYSATVKDGRWVMNGVGYPSLFALSMTVADSQENPWVHWKYRDTSGRVNLISALRKLATASEPAAEKKKSRPPKKPGKPRAAPKH
jgi:hypothetical protein